MTEIGKRLKQMKTYVVGGAVRDLQMGLFPKDVDYVVVGATPEEMLAKGFKQVGADFPVFLDDKGEEYALARTERKTGRGYNGFETDHSSTVTLEQDLERRDLTINAMAMMEDGTLCDPFNGLKDVEDKVLRMVSPAFADDPVRVLRLARFHARYGPEWTIDPGTLAFCRSMVDNGELNFLTKERIVAELFKALSEPHPGLFFKTLLDCGALDVVFPGFDFRYKKPDRIMQHFGWPEKYPSLEYAYYRMSLVLMAEDYLTIPSECVKYAKMARVLYYAWQDSPLVELYRIDAFRQSAMFERIAADFKQTGEAVSIVGAIIEAYEMTKDIRFTSLAPEVQDQLQKEGGPAIAKAIRAERERVHTEKTGWAY